MSNAPANNLNSEQLDEELTAYLDIEALTRNLASLKEMGFLPVALDPKPYVDLSFIDEAARRLKPAQVPFLERLQAALAHDHALSTGHDDNTHHRSE
jgi:hypothetical protein